MVFDLHWLRPTLFLQFVPDVLHIREDAKKQVLAVHSTVPIPCHGFEHNRRCKVTLALSVHESGVCLLVCESLTMATILINYFSPLFVLLYILNVWVSKVLSISVINYLTLNLFLLLLLFNNLFIHF